MKRLTSVPTVLLALIAVSMFPAAAGGVSLAAEEAGSAAPATTLVPIRNARIPMEGVLSGGQPTRDQIEAVARAGFRTVINLRTDQEPGFEWEREMVERLGMRYVQIPVAGANGLTRDNVELIDTALREARGAGPVLMHCASGNRIGAVLALRAAWEEGADPEEALQYGLSTGLTRLEGATRGLLGLDDADAKPAEKK